MHYWSENITWNSTKPSWVCDNNNGGVITWAFFCFLFFLFGFPACLAILWDLFQRHRKGTLLTPNNLFMLNLTVMDLVFWFFVPTGVLNFLFWHNLPFHSFFGFLYTLSISGRPLFMACICLDCYLAVVHPITYRTRKSLTPRVLMAVIVWAATLAYGIAFALVPRFFLNPIGCLPHGIALLITGFCDFFILRTLKRSDPGGRDLHPQKKKAHQIIINSLVMTVTSYLPPMLTYCFRILISPVSLDVDTCIVVLLMIFIPTTLGNAVMPILYLQNLGKFECMKARCCKT